MNTETSTPWHLWAIGIISLLWNAMGALDYVMTQTQNAQYMSGFTPEQLAFVYGLPLWVVSAWGIAVWGGVFGSLGLLLRKGVAVPVFLISFIGMAITSFHNYVLSNALEVNGDPFAVVFSGIIFVVALALFYYARAMRARSVLRS